MPTLAFPRKCRRRRRIYHPLERTTGFGFGYAAGYGILGGISPLVVTAFKAGLSAEAANLAPAFCESAPSPLPVLARAFGDLPAPCVPINSADSPIC
jgi:hypothetical protein